MGLLPLYAVGIIAVILLWRLPRRRRRCPVIRLYRPLRRS